MHAVYRYFTVEMDHVEWWIELGRDGGLGALHLWLKFKGGDDQSVSECGFVCLNRHSSIYVERGRDECTDHASSHDRN